MRRIILSVIAILPLLLFTGCADERNTSFAPADGNFPTAGLASVPDGCFLIREALASPPLACYGRAQMEAAYPDGIPAAFTLINDDRYCEDRIFRLPDLNQIQAITDGSYTPVLDPETGSPLATSAQVGMVRTLFIMVDEFVSDGIRVLYQALGGPGAPFRGIINTLGTLAIMFFFASMMLGIRDVTMFEGVLLFAKIIFVWVFATNYDVFEENFIGFFEEGIVNGLASIIIASVSNESEANFSTLGRFEEIDAVISTFTQAKFFMLLAAMAINLKGWVFLILLITLLFLYLNMVFKVLGVYLVAYFARALLYASAPLFFTFLLLNQTKSLFQGWLTQLISYSIQPLLVMTLLSFFHLILRAFLTEGGVLRDETSMVCVRPLWSTAGGIVRLINFWQLSTANGSKYEGTEVEFPVNLSVLFTLIILTWLMTSMLQWAKEMGARLGGGAHLAANVTMSGWDIVKQKALRPVASAVGGAKGAIFGQATGSGIVGHVIRSGGVLGVKGGDSFAQRVKNGASTGADNARRKQNARVHAAMHADSPTLARTLNVPNPNDGFGGRK